MKLPQYAQREPKNRLVKIHCRGKCQTGRWARIKDNGNNNGGTEISTNSIANCLICNYTASDVSNWKRA
jgi:hypothetical protein